MMVFLFISIIYSKDAEQRSRNAEVVNEWQDNEVRIYNALTKEFKVI